MRALLAWLSLAGLAPILAACGENEAASSQQQSPQPPAVTVAKPLVKELVEWDEFTGRFNAMQQVEVRARVTGYLNEVHFEDGQLVEKGQLLFSIDERPFKVALSEAEASLEQARAQAQLANQNLERSRALVERQAIPQANFDDNLQEKRAADAAVAAAEAAIEAAELDLDFATVEAPIAGRISDNRVDVGNLVQGEGNPSLLTTIVSLDPIYFSFDMSENDFLAYTRAAAQEDYPSTRDDSTPIAVKLVDEEGWPHEGTMNFVDNRVNANTGTIRGRAIVRNDEHIITPGQFGRLRLPGSPRYPAVLVPDSALVTDQTRRMVMSVDGDNVVVPIEVRPGPTEQGLRIIRRGLEGDERIVIRGLLRARPGNPVTPEEGEITTETETTS